jgi:hypothetical protein
MNAQARTAAPRPAAPAVIQRRCACGAGKKDDCEECQAKRLQRKPSATAAHPGAPPPIVDSVLQSSGHALDAGTRTYFERRLGRDFSDVRIHADDRAAESARAINAYAYTSGRHVVFAAGQYATHSERGRRLLAHELTHVIQQRSHTGSPGIAAPDDAAEVEAARNEARFGTSDALTFHARPRIVSRQAAPAAPAVCDPKQEKEVDPAFTTASAWLDTAIDALDVYIGSPGPGSMQDALVKHFHSADAAVATHVRTNLRATRTEVRRFNRAAAPGGGARRQPGFTTLCATAEDSDCSDLVAFVRDQQMVFCPSFFGGNRPAFRAGVVIHEVAHTLVGLNIEDRAYKGDRLYEFLTPTEALNNAESYEQFAREIATGQAMKRTAPRDKVDGCPPAIEPMVREAMGRAQRWNADAREDATESSRARSRLFRRHLRRRGAASREEAVRIFQTTESKLKSSTNVVCDPSYVTGCTSRHRAYGVKENDNEGLGKALGSAIASPFGAAAGLKVGGAMAALNAGAFFSGLFGLLAGLAVVGVGFLIGRAIGRATSTPASIHLCTNWRSLPPDDRAESILAAAYEAFAGLKMVDSRHHASLARALHDASVGPAPQIPGIP